MTTKPEKKNQHLLKLIIIGDCGVGKTNILMRFCQNTFKTNYVSTIGVDFKIKTIDIQGTRIKFQIWDTAGQQRYRNIAQTYYKGAAGIVLTYSVTEQKTFQNLQKWIKQINQHAPEEVVRMLVGNKRDVNQDERQVSTLEGKTLADKNGFPFIEVSAKTGQNIAEAFQIIGKQIVQNYLPNQAQQDERMLLSRQMANDSHKKKKDCQC